MSATRLQDVEYQRTRSKIIKRDQGRCVDCGWTQSGGGGKQLHAHHVVPERLFDDGPNPHRTENLVTLCSMCHGAWEKEFRAMMSGMHAWNEGVRNRVRKRLGDDVEFLEEHFPEVYDMVVVEVCEDAK